VARERLAKGRTLDKFEREQGEFFTRVRDVYLERARAEPARMRVVDTSRPRTEVRAELEAIVAQLKP
jgi:dTMP kinase